MTTSNDRRALIDRLLGPGEPEVTCDECFELLDQYVDLEAGGDDPAGFALRGWIALLATYSPNAYVVEIERERSLVLLHDLLPRRSSEEPA